MLILVINAGSSSIKYQLFDLPHKDYVAKGVIERIGERKSFVHYNLKGSPPLNKNVKIGDHRQGIKLLLSLLTDKKFGALNSLKQLSGIGHRVVHGGEEFRMPCLITGGVLKKIKEYGRLAPLHNPAEASVIEACLACLRGVPQVAVFDTAFHSSMPERAYMYGLPYRLYKNFGIRRYGFHGTSHQYVVHEAAKVMNRPLNKLKLITCHLGNGCSMAAVEGGKSIDTSMGFTPMEGLVMGTRPGDFDPSIILFLLKNNYKISEINDILNRKSGLLGLSGLSNDVRDINKAVKRNNKRAKLAIDVFVYRIQKYVGAYVAVLGGLDALIFTAGIGENQSGLRANICAGLKFLLKVTGAKILVIKTDEEYMISRQAYSIIKKIK
ncbi:MAG: acetate kinase [Candidatus Omnitrophica bacterium]|nr:acetate kinase [Candidatus Omnitrophota bacterium]